MEKLVNVTRGKDEYVIVPIQYIPPGSKPAKRRSSYRPRGNPLVYPDIARFPPSYHQHAFVEVRQIFPIVETDF